jgi:catechol 2,3-dioxygenase-like lactoylglutathione lyase family enzyme
MRFDKREDDVPVKEVQRMSLSSSKVCPGADVTFINQKTWVAVSDIVHVTDFYEEKLGLDGVEDPSDGSRVYACGGGTSLHVYVSPTLAGEPAATLATWYVTDIEQMVDELSSSGVTFERYDEPAIKTDDRGIAATSEGKVARFKDPDGNIFAIEQ